MNVSVYMGASGLREVAFHPESDAEFNALRPILTDIRRGGNSRAYYDTGEVRIGGVWIRVFGVTHIVRSGVEEDLDI